MVRILNFVCVALTGLACLALYHVSEQTRVANVELTRVNHKIAQEQDAMSVLQAEWARVADPARIQQLARRELGVSDAPTLELSSLELLPRRGQAAPLGGTQTRPASITVPVKREDPRIHLAALQPGN
jgi:cell division protein FtsL